MPNDDTIDLSRRKILAGLGAAGAASAGAGLGTSAFFTDEESFARNSIAAGNLDLKVDWEEHYSFQNGAETDGLDYDVVRSEPEEAADDYVGLPDPEEPVVWVHEDDLETYMTNTAVEAFPDPDDDGSQEIVLPESEFVYNPCEDGADLPEHMDPTSADGLRTENDDTYDAESGEYHPLINLDDVKPGDFGELTLSFHLCDNPGYVWLRADDVTESENGLTEPEAEVDETSETGELVENVQTVWWYDTDGDNVVDESIGAVDVVIAVDTSGSLTDGDVSDLESAANDLATDLDASADARVGGLSFGTDVENFTALADGPVNFSGLTAGGQTAMPAALEIAAAELDANGRDSAETFIVMFTDGGPNYGNTEYSLGGHTVGGGYTGGVPNSSVEDGELGETADIADAIREDHRILTVGIDDDRTPTGNASPNVGVGGSSFDTLSEYLQTYIAGSQGDYFSADDSGAVQSLLQAILEAIAVPEQVFHRGTLEEDLNSLSSGEGWLLGDEGDCFQPGVTYYIGFGWWLPLDVGNEVQSDSLSFDLGFYTEQCRNNDLVVSS